MVDAHKTIERTANVVAVCGAMLCLFPLINLIQFGMTILRRFMRQPSFDGFPVGFVIESALPLSYLVLSYFIRQGRYTAYVTAVVLALNVFIRQLIGVADIYFEEANLKVLRTVRFAVLFSVFCLTYLTLIVQLWRSRQAWADFPDFAAVDAAQRRLRIALSVQIALVVYIAISVGFGGTYRDGLSRWLLMYGRRQWSELLAVVSIVFIVIAVRALRTKPMTRRISLWLLITLPIVLLLDLISNGAYSNYREMFPLVSVWCLIELIHSRRICVGPPAQGFEPIFARPVLPIGSNDGVSS